MGDFPRSVVFHEEGPREGFQMEQRLYPREARRELIHALADTGLRQVQVGSFVSAKAVPSMADIAELFAELEPRDGVRYTALWLNKTGFERARATPNVDLCAYLALYLTDAFSQQNNNCTVTEMRERQREWAIEYQRLGLPIEKAYVMTAFGCNFAGPVSLDEVIGSVRWIHSLAAELEFDLPRIMLADTVGWASPEAVKRAVGAVRELLPEARLGLHLHDTRGLGAANVYAALEMGVDQFDSSVAGLGGCPFANHTNVHGAGNVCTEDMVFMCEEMGISTGVDLEALIHASQMAEEIIGRPLAGKLMHSGLPKR